MRGIVSWVPGRSSGWWVIAEVAAGKPIAKTCEWS
jgi:hypothetical protein